MWWVLGLVVAIVAGWGAFSTHHLLYPKTHPLDSSTSLLALTRHRITAPDGVTFELWLLEHPAPLARVLVLHGYYGDRFQVLGLAEGLRQRGYELLLCELRGHGGRPGPCTLGAKETDDAMTVLRWADQRHPAASLPVAVIGFSMGAVVACQLAWRIPTIRAVVADSAYARFRPILAQSIRRTYHLPAIPWAWITWWSVQLRLGRRLSAIDPSVIANKVHQPLLAIYGQADRRVSPQLWREFYDRWAGPKEDWVEPGIGHVGAFAAAPQRYCNRVAEFLQQHLPQRAT